MHPFRAAVEAHDLDGMTALLAEDVLFHSPVAFRPFTGREAAAGLLGQIVRTFEDFRYTDELEGPGGVTTLIFRARVGDRAVEGVDILRPNADGLIGEFTVMLRPVSGLMAVAEKMTPVASTLAKADADAGHTPG